ncbi:MAG: hypothetical protein ACRC68_04410 [Clostridium sp.]
MGNETKFINSKHEENYLELCKQFSKDKGIDFDIALKLLSVEEVYYITKDYIDEMGVKFRDLLKDSRVTKDILFICELAYSLFIKLFLVKSIAGTKKLQAETRNFIIDILYVYQPNENKAS